MQNIFTAEKAARKFFLSIWKSSKKCSLIGFVSSPDKNNLHRFDKEYVHCSYIYVKDKYVSVSVLFQTQEM
jgi:hypothetical protein